MLLGILREVQTAAEWVLCRQRVLVKLPAKSFR